MVPENVTSQETKNFLEVWANIETAYFAPAGLLTHKGSCSVCKRTWQEVRPIGKDRIDCPYCYKATNGKKPDAV